MACRTCRLQPAALVLVLALAVGAAHDGPRCGRGVSWRRAGRLLPDMPCSLASQRFEGSPSPRRRSRRRCRRELQAAARPAIVGGSDVPLADRRRYPWMVQLRSAIAQEASCGGSLIGDGRWVLTAGES